MSLGPREFEGSIGVARVAEGAVLVFRHKLKGHSPCGADGWNVYEQGDFLVHGSPFDHADIFPPGGGLDASRRLRIEVDRIRMEHAGDGNTG